MLAARRSSNQVPSSSSRLNNVATYILVGMSMLLGLVCLSGFVITTILWNLNERVIDRCSNDTQPVVLCFIRHILADAMVTPWHRYILVNLILTYASVLLFIINESSRTNVTGLLGQMILQTMLIILGIGVAIPLVFTPSYVYFYKSSTGYHDPNKSPVPIDRTLIGIVYIIIIVIFPTYLVYFLHSNVVLLSILSIILLASPLLFGIFPLPFRLLTEQLQQCWLINSHRLIVRCQILLFILSAPLFFVSLVSLFMHWPSNLLDENYILHQNAIAVTWSIDYSSLIIGLILFICIRECLFTDNMQRISRSSIKMIIARIGFAICFVVAPCLAFPVYVAWKEYQYVNVKHT